MLSRLLGWGPWQVVMDVPVKEQRKWIEYSPYGHNTYTWEGRQVTYRRDNKRTGKRQYKYEEFRGCS